MNLVLDYHVAHVDITFRIQTKTLDFRSSQIHSLTPILSHLLV